jgi:FkbM family methyltransferase
MNLKQFASRFARVQLPGNARPRRDTHEFEQMRAMLTRLEAKVDEALLGLETLRRRQSVYVGEKVVLTHLADDTPIYVNSLDFGGPANLLNGGEYEPDNLDVLLSFVRDDTVFLDIGANLGFFSLMIARRVHRHGKVYAFEPNPEMARLFRASAYINGLSELTPSASAPIVIHRFAAGDANIQTEFWAPAYHAGGGAQVTGVTDQIGSRFAAQIRKLDDVFDTDFRCDLVKIDVEGHEIAVLQGMRSIIARSPKIKIIFEKLTQDSGCEDVLESFFAGFSLSLYGVNPDASLVRFERGDLAKFGGYVLAAPKDEILEKLQRRSFRIYPRQLYTPPQTIKRLTPDLLHAAGSEAQFLFHGPYWRLRSGVYEFQLVGNITGEIEFCICARFGHKYASTVLSGENPKATFVIARDLIYFECTARSLHTVAEIHLRAINVTRIG